MSCMTPDTADRVRQKQSCGAQKSMRIGPETKLISVSTANPRGF